MKPWRITGFYDRTEEHLRHETRGLLRHLKIRHFYPWVCVRDDNEILVLEEKQGRLTKAQNLMQEFRSVLLHCGLIDLGFMGNQFTWNNGHESDAYVQQRLDRACASVEWREIFPQAQLPILLTT